MNPKIARLWNSPTLMTWLSYATRAFALFGVLPLILKRFSEADVVLWYLFSTIISLQAIADFGFRSTFSRLISFAFGGSRSIGRISNTGRHDPTKDEKPNIELLSRIQFAMKRIYLVLTGIALVLLATFGTWSMLRPIRESHNVTEGWISWSIVLVTSCVSFYFKIYLNYLEGLNFIAKVRRLEAVTSLGSIATSIIVLLFSPSLLHLVIANQIWIIIVAFRDWYLAKTVLDRFYSKIDQETQLDKELFKEIWEPAWRSGISGIMSSGLTNVTGIIYAQLGQTKEVASYLLALRIINQIRDVSMAPFYSKLPVMAMLRVKQNIPEFTRIVKKGMLMSHLVYVVCFVIVGTVAAPLLAELKVSTQFVEQKLWLLMGIAFFIHRFGAMHIQTYLSTNHVISHIADGISGLIYIISCVLLVKILGVYTIPVAMILGYLGFYSWYAAGYSYKSINSTFWDFERSVTLIPAIIIASYAIFVIIKQPF